MKIKMGKLVPLPPSVKSLQTSANPLTVKSVIPTASGYYFHRSHKDNRWALIRVFGGKMYGELLMDGGGFPIATKGEWSSRYRKDDALVQHAKRQDMWLVTKCYTCSITPSFIFVEPEPEPEPVITPKKRRRVFDQ